MNKTKNQQFFKKHDKISFLWEKIIVDVPPPPPLNWKRLKLNK
jgi:hypothetical protein